MSDPSTYEMRRKVLLGLFPFLLQAVTEIGSMPKIHFGSSSDSYQDDLVRDVLEKLKGRLQISKTGDEIHVTMDLELLIEFVEEYLRREYAGEGGASSVLNRVDKKLGTLNIFAVMKIPHRYIYVSFSDVDMQKETLEQFAEEISPNHLYILTSENRETDVHSTPLFVGENKVLWGRVRCLPISKLLHTTVGLEMASDFQLSSNRLTFLLKSPP